MIAVKAGGPDDEIWCVSANSAHNVVANGIAGDNMIVTLFSDTGCTNAITGFETDGCKVIPSNVSRAISPFYAPHMSPDSGGKIANILSLPDRHRICQDSAEVNLMVTSLFLWTVLRKRKMRWIPDVLE